MNLRTIENIYHRTKSYIERNGVAEAAVRSVEGVKDSLRNVCYSREARLARNDCGSVAADFDKEYKISLLVPTYNTDPQYLRELLISFAKQTYRNFEVIIADASDTEIVKNTVDGFIASDEKLTEIHYKKLESNEGISGNTNAALALATGDFVAPVDHDDFLSDNALAEVMIALQGEVDIVYTDEDKYYGPQDKYFSPNRKPDFNLDLLLSNNYICHLFVVRRDIANAVGGFRSEFDGAQDYDFILRCIEKSGSDRVAHVDRIVYHWRASDGSTADNPESKLYAYESGRRVVEAYLERRGLKGEVVHTKHRGFYRINYEMPEDAGYKMLLDKKLIPMRDDYEERLAAYFAREEVGAVGGRIVGSLGNIICNGYTTDACGRRVSLYAKMNQKFSGYMHRASMQQDVEAVSNHACVVRQELLQYYDKDSMKMFENIRRAGYLVVIDPEVVFTYIR